MGLRAFAARVIRAWHITKTVQHSDAVLVFGVDGRMEIHMPTEKEMGGNYELHPAHLHALGYWMAVKDDPLVAQQYVEVACGNLDEVRKSFH